MWYWSIVPPKSYEQAFDRIVTIPGVTGVMFVSPWGLPAVTRGKLSRRDNVAIAGYAMAIVQASRVAGSLPFGAVKTNSTVFDGMNIHCSVVVGGLLVFCWEADSYRADVRSRKWAEVLSKVEH